MNTRERPQPEEAAEAATLAQDLPVPPADAPLEPTQPKDGKESVNDWPNILFPESGIGRQHPDRWKHGAAAARNQWAKWEHDNNAPLRLTKEQYEQAIALAIQPEPKALNLAELGEQKEG
jgi:hypothetical protein